MEALEGGGRRLARLLTPAALFALAFLVRCLPIQGVFLREGTAFVDPDAYYHMRRIVYTIASFPRSLGFDPYINHPDGGQPIWTPLFDWCVAALLLPLGSGDVARLERVAVFVPPLLGAATVVALWGVARRHFGAAPATLAGVILAVLSAHFWYSQVSFLDHHAAEALAATLALGAAMTLLARASVAEPSPASLRRSELATGVALGAALLLWPGMLLHVGLVDAGLVAFALGRRERAAAAAFARGLAVVHAVAFVLVAPFALSARWTAWGPFSPVVLSAFQPWLMAIACLWSAACAALWRGDATGRTPARRLLASLALAALLLAASLGAFPGLAAAAGEPWEWFAGDDPFQRAVGESMPLFVHAGRPSLEIALVRLSAFSLLLPLALGAGVWLTLRRERPAPLLLFFWWTFGLAAATVVQRRFFNAAAVGVALLFALSLVGAQRALRGRFPRARVPAAAALTAAALGCLLPTLPTYALHASNAWRALRGDPPQVTVMTLERAVLLELAGWIRRHTPEPSPWLDASVKPAWGILAPWWLGHLLEYQARRPTVTDNFGNDLGRRGYEAALRYFASDEASAALLLDELSARYVVVQRDTEFLGAAPGPDSMAVALFRRDGSRTGPGADAAAGTALERHRLVYDSRPLPFTTHPQEPRYKVFEVVPGARIEGESAPGARIRASLALWSNRGRRFTYETETVAAPDGRYALRVPYATQGGPSGIRVEPAWALECGEERGALRIEEAAVRAGARVEGPRLCVAR